MITVKLHLSRPEIEQLEALLANFFEDACDPQKQREDFPGLVTARDKLKEHRLAGTVIGLASKLSTKRLDEFLLGHGVTPGKERYDRLTQVLSFENLELVERELRLLK